MQQRVNFENRNQLKLAGILHVPDTQDIVAYALFAHCFTCTKSINAAANIADSLSRQGIATLRFDFTGLGASKGDFSETNFTSDVHDLIDAAGYLAEHHQAPQLLVGHSLGGTAILAASFEIDSAKAVVSIGSPSSPEHILHLLECELPEIEAEGAAEVSLAGRPFTFKQDFVDDVRAYSIDYNKLNKALMVMHSPIDDTVSVDEAAKIFSSAKHPKSFVSLNKANHLMSNKEDSHYAGEVITSWAAQYIEPLTFDYASDEGHDGGVLTSADTALGFLCKINASGHQIIADEPKSMGGTNLGPSPYDFLASALGSCTAMTLNMYARHKKINVSNVTVHVEHSRVHADDCVDCEQQSGQIHVLTRTISIEGDLDEAQRARMLQIADRCPVHKTLEHEIKIVSQLDEQTQ